MSLIPRCGMMAFAFRGLGAVSATAGVFAWVLWRELTRGKV